MPAPHPTHLDQRDPAEDPAEDIRQAADREIAAYPDHDGLVLLMPEDRWDEFLRLTATVAEGDEASYAGVRFRRAAVTAVIAH